MENAITPAHAPGTELATLSKDAVALWNQATQVAKLVKELVVKSAVEISGRKHVRVEGWMAIAVAHGYIATIKSVENTPTGMRAIAELRRQSDGAFLTSAEGFVGVDEPVWYGGLGRKVVRERGVRTEKEVTFPKRPEFAIRAMAQTRAISRVCRAAFAHVVIVIDAGLDTTPAEDITDTIDIDGAAPADAGTVGSSGAIDQAQENAKRAAEAKMEAHNAAQEKAAAAPTAKPVEVPRDPSLAFREQFADGRWEKFEIHFGKWGPDVAANKPHGTALGELPHGSLKYFIEDWQPKPFGNKQPSEKDYQLRAALDAARDQGALDRK